jgi:beta-mannanase
MQGNSNQLALISISMLNVQQEGKKTLDHLDSTHRDRYKAPFVKSDHNSILLIPAYKQKLKQEAPVTRSIRKWSDEADAKLQDYFASRLEYVPGFFQWH